MTPEQEKIRTLSDRLVAAQKPIRILDSIKWDDEIRLNFFKNKAEKQPEIDKDYYLSKQALSFDPQELMIEFRTIAREAKHQLGEFSNVTKLISRRCEDYCKAVEMLSYRGTKYFSGISKELYGGPGDAFYAEGPRLSDLGTLLGDTLKKLTVEMHTELDEKRYTAQEAMSILQQRLASYFTEHDHTIIVKISDDMVSDAAAGADSITLNTNVMFSERDLKYLEVHEAWVHVGTTLNGASQPYCTFLSKGSPASSVTQEGLAVITEIFTFSSSPERLLRLTNRVKAIDLVNNGATFIDTFRFFKEQGFDDDKSYSYAMRVFRGSSPTDGPFTKDLSYTKGFILIYNYIRLAVQQGLAQQIPLFFVGKTLIEETQMLAELLEQGMITKPIYMPPQFKDLSALSSWMCFSLYLNKFDLATLAKNYRFMLHE